MRKDVHEEMDKSLAEDGYRRRTVQIIQEPSELRAFLLGCMVQVAEGRMNCTQANSIIGLSQEVHKSIRQQWDMHTYAASNLIVGKAEVIALEEIPDDGADTAVGDSESVK